MRNIKLEIEYKGNEYFGFQMQKNKKTVQGELVKALEVLFKEKIYIFYSGRTDKGVHALSQIINFNTEKDIDCFKIKKFLNMYFKKNNNKYLRVKNVLDVDLKFNANLSAKEKTYMYILNTESESGIFYDLEYTYEKDLDIEKMEKAIKYFIGKHDFKAFCNSDNETSTTIREIKDFTMEKKNGRLIFKITADGFLNKMVRIIIGTILDIGIGKINYLDIPKILELKDRKNAGRTISPKGLYLLDIKY